MNKSELMKTANEIRKGAITGVYSAKSGHPGGSLSAADIYSYLFFEELNIDPKIRKNRIAIVSSFPKDMLHLVITQLLQTVDIFRWKI